MHCSNCNSKISDDSKFCNFCGHQVVKSAVGSTRTSPEYRTSKVSYRPLEEFPLIDYLSSNVIKEAIKEKSRGRTFIHSWDYFFILSFLYELGAILGCSRQDKTGLLECMTIGSESNLSITDYQKMAEGRLRNHNHQFSKEPDTFYEFILERGIDNFVGPNPLHPHQKYIDYSYKKLEKTIKTFKKRYFELLCEEIKIKNDAVNTFLMPARRDDAARIRRYTLEGIGFGMAFPNLTEKMVQNFWDSASKKMDVLLQKWRTLHPAIAEIRQRAHIPQFSYNIANSLTILSFNEQLERILEAITCCIWLAYGQGKVEGYSDVLDSLDLKSYAPKGKERLEAYLASNIITADYVNWFIFTRFIEGDTAFIDVNNQIPLRSFGGILWE